MTVTRGAASSGAPPGSAALHEEIPPVPGERWFKVRRRLFGVAFLVVIALLAWVSIAAYNKQFSPVASVTLITDSTGNEMHLGADVMARGVIVGSVRAITSNGNTARLQLAIQPDTVSELPADVTAEMLPTTLFGERYVALVIPPNPVAQRLTGGSVISQDRSQDAIELEKVLDDLLPMLSAVQPDKLSATLSAISEALNGRGAELGQTLDEINSYWKKMNPELPTMDKDISQLVQVTRTYNQAAPGIVQALNDFTVTSRTFAAEQSNLNTLYSQVTGMAGNFTTFLQNNSSDIIRLSADSTGSLRILDRYSPEFPCVLQDLVNLEPAVNKALGAGSSQPGLHGRAYVVPVYASAAYVSSKNTPVYRDNTGPHCYPTPFTGTAFSEAAAGSPASLAGNETAGNGASTVQGGLGLANSPEENELINELLAPQAGTAPAVLPSWSSVLVGPVYRGAEVTIK